MSESYLIPDSWTVPVAAASIGCSEDEVRRMIESGEIDIDDYRTIGRVALRFDVERAEAFLTHPTLTKKSRARRS